VAFVTNLLAAGGIRAAVSSGTHDELAAALGTGGLTVACLCPPAKGGDTLGADEIAAAVAALRAAGASTVMLAGKAESPEGDGSAEQADDYLYRGCDAVAVLDRTLSALGVL
jgi:methylmalonyl-CoA mutase